ncbi:ELMO domain-containing protein 1 [Schistosoma haematobium]|uniref:ELMO domain-containing protein 1 n=1 Tax=Schistosoma haematobium TaxID=6185 RepID=A0A922LGZ1_SCHHA|nr:ELMO domain-containing protein 1 [Schistosoma haematobium]KAH9583728.1 ELMO domain-containing protein 1 [Schistosoma haematobium]CAH8573651.1 unnamed protein product [Schistosoma haematobium]CAH8580786.1 unnamed protein product [Schistosoma haematobium]
MNFLTYIFVYLFQVIYSIFRPMIKYISRLVTGRCELSRIIADCPKGAPRTVRIENSLRNSKNKSIQNGLLLGKCTDAKSHVQLVISAKRIDLKDQPNFPTDYLYCISQINSYRELINTLDASKCTAFNSDDHYHSELLSRLWICLDSQNELSSRNGEKWTLLGFQTENPETDFRGMGILSLENLVYFAESHTKLARSMLSASHRPNKWYPFAVTGIHLTKLSYNLMLKGYLKYQFYNMSSSASIQDFNEFYCYTFYSFHKFWTKHPRDIMQFNKYCDDFANKLKCLLLDVNCRLCLPEDKI